MPAEPAAKARLFVLSGPGGVGKDAVLKQMKAAGFRIHYPVTATTRPIRRGEVNGVDYHFLSREEFERMLAEGSFLEHAQVYGNHYGVPKSEVQEPMARGDDVLLKVDVQGAETVREMTPDAIRIFLAPASHADLQRWLEARVQETAEPPEALRVRLQKAEDEMAFAGEFDYVVYNRNGELEAAVAEIERIIETERARSRESEPV
ncbi:MAG TPA: guanylate kinase [Chloroflexota bacterium]|nr:guanylate kinase [Chloroflexota bacterium]